MSSIDRKPSASPAEPIGAAERSVSVADVRIVGLGSCVPDHIVTNHDIEQVVDTSDEWIVSRTGIRERRICGPETAASDLAASAAQRALDAAGLRGEDLDAIIVGTVTGDHLFPSTACLVQARIGAHKAFCFDLGAACSGFLYSCEVARGLIGSGLAERILVVGVEVLSRFTNPKDRTTCILFGDGAGAAVLTRIRPGEADHGHQILATYLGADGREAELIELPAGGSRLPVSHEVIEQGLHRLRMKGNEVFKLGVRGMEEACRITLERAGITAAEVDLLVAHQANLRIIEATAKRLDLPTEKVFINLDRYGNTSAASVPLALDEVARSARAKSGDLVLTVAFGAGLTWGGTLLRW